MDETPPPVHTNEFLMLVSAIVGIASSVVTGVLAALVSLFLKYRRESVKTDTDRKRATVELELTQRERNTKVDMEVHQQVVQQLTEIIKGYEERFKSVVSKNDEREAALIRQAEERELQFSSMMDGARKENQESMEKIRQGHLDCERKLAAADARLAASDMRVSMLEKTVQDLQAKVDRQGRR